LIDECKSYISRPDPHRLTPIAYSKGQIPIEVLVYKKQNIELAFSEGRLIGWRTIEEARQGRGFRFWTPTH
jgi:hypothetical protein